MTSEPGRKPPKSVRDQLCAEVGFRCPVDDCGLPYLTFHHFDPPWRTEKHHRPEGMIALCSNHAAKADGNHYPDEYLHLLKKQGRARSRSIEGKFEYMRQDAVVVIGTVAHYNPKTVLEINGRRCIYFERDSDGFLTMSFEMPSSAGYPRVQMRDNVWTIPPDARSVTCPPRGRLLKVEFANGDVFEMRLVEAESMQDLIAKTGNPSVRSLQNDLTFPITILNFWERSASGAIEFGRHSTQVGGITMTNCTMKEVQTVFSLEIPKHRLFSPGISGETFDILDRALADSPFSNPSGR